MSRNKRALVTAAANGIGRATALKLANDGLEEFVLVDHEADAMAETAETLREAGKTVSCIQLDCTDDAAVAASLSDVGKIDVLINAIGGSARGRQTDFWTSDPLIWTEVLNVSLRTVMLVSRQIVPGMRDRQYGRIVNISSDAALRPTVKLAEYAAAKAGVIGFTRALAVELGPYGVTVNVVCPGLTATRALSNLNETIMASAKAEIPMRRIGKPEEIASVIAFLVGDGSTYMTGQTLAVNGGRSMV